MVFSSVSFLVFFLPCLLVLYFMVPRRYRGARNFILLAFSLAFYACGGPKFLLLIASQLSWDGLGQAYKGGFVPIGTSAMA